MNAQALHDWSLTPQQARAQQTALRHLVSLEDGFGPICTVAGVDLSLSQAENVGHAVVVVLTWPDFQVVETRYATAPLLMPYVPGLLSFRETPVILKAFQAVQATPDLVFVDGQGLAHPRGFGIACHLGVLLNVPTVGVAKSRLFGTWDADALTDAAGASVPLLDRTQHSIGTVLRTKPRTNPLFVSPGHRVSVQSAARLVEESIRGYRLPEPTRHAHNLVTAYKKGAASEEAAPVQSSLF